MKYKITLLFLLNALILLAQQGAPATYYTNFNWNQTGTSLKNALSTKITSTHSKTLTYAQAENAIKIVDLEPINNNTTNVQWNLRENEIGYAAAKRLIAIRLIQRRA